MALSIRALKQRNRIKTIVHIEELKSGRVEKSLCHFATLPLFTYYFRIRNTAMKYTIQQVFRSGKFVFGFSIFATIVLIVLIYPRIVTDPPLTIIGQGTFFPPGIYVSVYDSLDATKYKLNLDNAAAKRIANKLSDEDRQAIKEWLVAAGIAESEIDTADTEKLLGQWESNYDPKKRIPGQTNAKRNYYVRLNNSLKGLLSQEGAILAVQNAESGALEQAGQIDQSDFMNVSQVANMRILPLGTDNFGRDMLTELVSATGTSLQIGFIAGLIATLRVSLRSAARPNGTWQPIESELKLTEHRLRGGVPEVCPRCNGAKCNRCQNRGWVERCQADGMRAGDKVLGR